MVLAEAKRGCLILWKCQQTCVKEAKVKPSGRAATSLNCGDISLSTCFMF